MTQRDIKRHSNCYVTSQSGDQKTSVVEDSNGHIITEEKAGLDRLNTVTTNTDSCLRQTLTSSKATRLRRVTRQTFHTQGKSSNGPYVVGREITWVQPFSCVGHVKLNRSSKGPRHAKFISLGKQRVAQRLLVIPLPKEGHSKQYQNPRAFV